MQKVRNGERKEPINTMKERQMLVEAFEKKRNQELDVVQIRMVKEPMPYCESTSVSPESMIQFLSDEFSSFDREVLGVLIFNALNQVMNLNIVTVESINRAIISPKEVFACSNHSNTVQAMLLHNLPSGHVFPSPENMQAINRLYHMGSLLHIPVLGTVQVTKKDTKESKRVRL